MQEITHGALFSGSGGFELAARMCGIKSLWASEIEPFPIKVTRARFPEMQHIGDIGMVNGAELPPVDIISGGSPCQDMSIAGRRQGLKGERSVLFMDYIRVVKEMRKKHGKPRYMVWENVPGAFSSNKGEDFRCVLEEIAGIAEPGVSIPRPPKGKWRNEGAIVGDGYSIAWRVLDAQFWGVPHAEDESFLSQILVRNAPERYSLSEKACLGILRRAEKKHKELPPLLKWVLEKQAGGA